MSDEYPKDLLYTKEHEWARIDGSTAVIGVTRFAVDQLGDVTMVELPAEGDVLSQGEVFGTVESVKAVSDLYAPLSGKVIESNTPLDDSPELVNEAPYDDGWMVKIELSAPAQKADLMTAEQYRAFVAEQDA
jgi:glycine cleavage system H protein